MTFNHIGEPDELLGLFVKDATNLELLMLGQHITSYVNVKAIDTPKLQLLGLVNADVWMLQLGETCFQVLILHFV